MWLPTPTQTVAAWVLISNYPMKRTCMGICRIVLLGHLARVVYGSVTKLSFLIGSPKLPHIVQVTPHRRGNRSATKFIRFVPVVSQCSKCNRVFQQHQLPRKCDKDDCPAFNLRRPEA